MNQSKEADLQQPTWLKDVLKEAEDEEQKKLTAELDAIRPSSLPQWLQNLVAESNNVASKKSLPDWLTQTDSSPTTAPKPEQPQNDQSDQNEPIA